MACNMSQMMHGLPAVSAVCLLLLPGAATAQLKPDVAVRTIRISGRVVDWGSAPIEHGSVVLTAADSGVELTRTLIVKNGEYTFPAVLPQTYDLHFEVPGFERAVKTVPAKSDIDAGQIVLSLGLISGPAEVETQNSEISTNLQAASISESTVASPIAAQAESNGPSDTTLCDLAQNLERFEGKLVRVRGTILVGMEQFELTAAECSERLIDTVWLEYGKGLKQPTTWCCGNLVSKDAAQVVQNAEFRKFQHYLTAQYRDKGCHEWECQRYSVTATLTGKFNAVKTETCPSGKGRCCPLFRGFGHYGASCARVVIQSASDVDAKPISRSAYETAK
jgi:hypothetical protein